MLSTLNNTMLVRSVRENGQYEQIDYVIYIRQFNAGEILKESWSLPIDINSPTSKDIHGLSVKHSLV